MAATVPGMAMAPAPRLAPGPSLVGVYAPGPTTGPWNNQWPTYGLSLPVTKVVTICLFVAAVLGFITIALFITYNFYRRRAIMQRERLAMIHGQAPAGPQREIPIHEGFIVANPCGEEQVAYKVAKEKETELTEIVVDSGSESGTEMTGTCTADASTQTSPSLDRSQHSLTADPPATSGNDTTSVPASLPGRRWSFRNMLHPHSPANRSIEGAASVPPPNPQPGSGSEEPRSQR